MLDFDFGFFFPLTRDGTTFPKAPWGEARQWEMGGVSFDWRQPNSYLSCFLGNCKRASCGKRGRDFREDLREVPDGCWETWFREEGGGPAARSPGTCSLGKPMPAGFFLRWVISGIGPFLLHQRLGISSCIDPRQLLRPLVRDSELSNRRCSAESQGGGIGKRWSLAGLGGLLRGEGGRAPMNKTESGISPECSVQGS